MRRNKTNVRLGTCEYMYCLQTYAPSGHPSTVPTFKQRLFKMRSSFIVSLLSIAPAVNGYAYPMACSGVCTNAHDPALIRRDDGTYFRFSTGGKIAIHSAPSITGPWTYKGAAIPAGSKINLNGKNDLWVRSLHVTRCSGDELTQCRLPT